MRIRPYKFSTSERLDLINFHDAWAGRLIRKENGLCFGVFDLILKSDHPANPYVPPMYIDEGVICFQDTTGESFTLAECTYSENGVDRVRPETKVDCLEPERFDHLNVIVDSSPRMQIRAMADVATEFSTSDMSYWEFTCSGFLLRWNAFICSAWYWKGERIDLRNE